MDNALVYDDGTLLNKGGLRMDDECVKHKALDCLGDLYLLGMPSERSSDISYAGPSP